MGELTEKLKRVVAAMDKVLEAFPATSLEETRRRIRKANARDDLVVPLPPCPLDWPDRSYNRRRFYDLPDVTVTAYSEHYELPPKHTTRERLVALAEFLSVPEYFDLPHQYEDDLEEEEEDEEE